MQSPSHIRVALNKKTHTQNKNAALASANALYQLHCTKIARSILCCLLHQRRHVRGKRDLVEVAHARLFMEPDVLLRHDFSTAWMLACDEPARALHSDTHKAEQGRKHTSGMRTHIATTPNYMQSTRTFLL